MKALTYAVVAVVAVAILGDAIWWWYVGQQNIVGVEQPAAASQASMSTAAEPTSPLPSQSSASAGARYPVPASADGATAEQSSLEDAIAELVGRKAVLTLLQTDDFAHRFTATVDNLGRERASARLWPANPSLGRFMVTGRDDHQLVDPDNGQRYTPYVLLLETLDLPKAVRLYFRFYPDFNRAYASLGFPGRHFNDRLVEVLDMLLATPDVAYPIEVTFARTAQDVSGSMRSPYYEFKAPELQLLNAGQKMLVRMGPVNARRIKGRLAELRSLLTAGRQGR